MAHAPRFRRFLALAALTTAAIGAATPAAAQLDNLQFVKRTRPNVILLLDVAERMQFDADGAYYDPQRYTRTGQAYEMSLGVTPLMPFYHRKYVAFRHLDSGSDKYYTTQIAVSGDSNAFYDRSRLGAARKALIQAVTTNQRSARFGFLKMRQQNPRLVGSLNEWPVFMDPANVAQQFPTDYIAGRWKLTRPVVDATNASIETTSAALNGLIRAELAASNGDILTLLNRKPYEASALLAAGRDGYNLDDAPLAHLLDDARAEAVRLIGLDVNTEKQCRNTIAVYVAGGGEGTVGHSPTAESIALSFRSVSARRVPIYVVGLAPDAAAVPQLKAIAANSGGMYFEVTKAQIDAAVNAGIAVPEIVRVVNLAIQHAMADPTDFNFSALPSVAMPHGPSTEHQVTSPIVGTVNLENLVTNGKITTAAGTVIPQRANVMVTSGFALPGTADPAITSSLTTSPPVGFEGRLRAFRVYKPVADASKPSGYKFVADGSALWTASVPAENERNIYTTDAQGNIIPFTTPYAASLLGFLRPYGAAPTVADAEALISFIRSQPLGAIVGSTPAFMDPPSLDPPPDEDYPNFASANKHRRTLVFVGASDGMLHAFDGRTGQEVWAFIPHNLLPKLKALVYGQSLDRFSYFVDSSPKIADVKVDIDNDGSPEWRTFLYIGQGGGGTFYQALDVTLDGMDESLEIGSVAGVRAYFADQNRIKPKWSFPRFTQFDPALGEFGELKATASGPEKTVGETWSDPAVGQIESATGQWALITGSGFYKASFQGLYRGGTVAGTTLYLIDAGKGPNANGDPLDFKTLPVENPARGETVDDCTQVPVKGCSELKNALQADPVATGPADSRFISKAYIGDVDGRLWRFDIGMVSGVAKFKSAPLKLYEGGADQPLYASMATVGVGPLQYIFFGTGSDLLPSVGVSTSYRLVSVLDQGTSGSKTFEVLLTKTDGLGDDEKISAFPAVAGDIVFFTTTAYKPATPCTKPDAALYGLTFVGGAAYDATGDNKVTKNETSKVRTLAAAGRATAPFIVDQHLSFGAGGKISLFGDPEDFNNGVGQAGVRILSWRELR